MRFNLPAITGFNFNVGLPNDASAVVKAVAKKSGYFNSPIATANYGDNIMPALTLTPAGGAAVPVAVTIGLPSSFTGAYNIVYCTSTTGAALNPLTNPTAAITAPGPLTLNLAVGTSIAAYASATGWTNSAVATAAYGLSIVNAPTITLPPAGSGIGTTYITADPTGPAGQSIVYTINGGAPVTALSPAGFDLSDVPGVNGAVAITAYSTYPGWTNSPNATQQTQPLLLSGLIDVNFAPPGAAAKVGRMAISVNPFTDVWNPVGATPGLLSTLTENFYADGQATAQAPGAAAATQLSFTPGTGTFGVIPYIGDNAYKNFLQIGSNAPTTNEFRSIAYSTGAGSYGPRYVAVTSGGEIWSSPNGIIWTEQVSGLPELKRVVFVSQSTQAGSGLPFYAYIGFIVVGAGTVMISQNGVNWTNISGNLPAAFTVMDAALNTAGQMQIVGSGGLEYTWSGSLPVVWASNTPTSNKGANLNSVAIIPSTTTQAVVAVGDAGTIYSGSTLIANAYDQVSFQRITYNALIGQYCFVSKALNGVTETYTMTAAGGINATGALPAAQSLSSTDAGVTNLLDVAAYQYGFIAVGDSKILWGVMSGGTLNWTDITPVGAGGNSSEGGSSLWGSSWGEIGSDMGPPPFNYKGVTVGANGQVVICGDQGIIYGSFNGLIWVFEWSSQVVPLSTPTPSVLTGTFSNLTPGFYDLLIYGHGSIASESASFNAFVDGNQVKDVNGNLAPSTATDSTFQNTNWAVDRQYVDFTDLETQTGTIAFGLLASGSAGTTYTIETVQWTEYGLTGLTGNPNITTGVNGLWHNLTFNGVWPTNWPTTIYAQMNNNPGSPGLDFYSGTGGSGTHLGYANVAALGGNGITNLTVGGGPICGSVTLTGANSKEDTITEVSGAFKLLGGSAQSIAYSTTTVNPGVAIGGEIVSAAQVGNQIFTSKTIPAGTSSLHPGGSGTLQQTAIRQYLAGVSNSNGGFINAVQLSRRSGAGVRMNPVVLLPDNLANLPFPAHAGGDDLLGLFLSPADIALGIAPISQIYYSIVTADYATYQTYLTYGATAAGISADPTQATGTLYSAPLSAADNGTGIIVRAIAVCVGRTTSNVASAFYFPTYPESNPPQ